MRHQVEMLKMIGTGVNLRDLLGEGKKVHNCLRIRTIPGLITVNACGISEPYSRMTNDTIAAFVSTDNPAKRRSYTPAVILCWRNTNSPKSLSAVNNKATCWFALFNTVSSEILGSISTTASTPWPSRRSRSTMG